MQLITTLYAESVFDCIWLQRSAVSDAKLFEQLDGGCFRIWQLLPLYPLGTESLIKHTMSRVVDHIWS